MAWSVVWAAVAASAAGAQVSAGRPVQGRALDEATGAVLPAVRVELLPQGRLTLTSAEGTWKFDDVEPGDYAIRVTAEGFEVATVPVVLSAGPGPVVQEVVLKRRPYHAHESVTVTALRDTARAYDVPTPPTLES